MTTMQGRLDRGEVIILDGAMGTELERRGVPMHSVAWSGAALLTHPDTVRQVHEDYIRAGADVIIANTFATARHALEPAGMGDQVREVNTRAVALAQEARERTARDRPVLIAGSISTFRTTGRAVGPLQALTKEQALANYREQAELLAEAGADLIALEMMQDTEQSTYALQAALSTGLPTWVGFSCKMAGDGSTVVLLNGEPGHTFAQDMDSILSLGGSLVSVMHTNVEDTAPALQAVLERWPGPVGAYPHSGEFVMPNWQFANIISPEDFAGHAERWAQMGVQVIGTCCGMGPEYIRLLRDRLPTHVTSSNGWRTSVVPQS